MKKLFMTMALVAAVFTFASCEKENAADEKLKVTYAANNGTNETAVEQVDMGTEITFTATSWTYTGYIFKGWDTDQDATTPAYEIGDKLTINANTTIYAIWEKEVTNTITLNGVSKPIIKVEYVDQSPYSTSNCILFYTAETLAPNLRASIQMRDDRLDGQEVTLNTNLATDENFDVYIKAEDITIPWVSYMPQLGLNNFSFYFIDVTNFISIPGGEMSVSVEKTDSNIRAEISLSHDTKLVGGASVSYNGPYISK